MDAIPESLLSAINDRYGIDGSAAPVAPGVSGSSLWRLDSAPPVLVRVSRHYQLADSYRTGRVVGEFGRIIPEAISPLIATNGEPAFLWDGKPVTLWPFVDGQELDRHDPVQLRQAAGLLARLHCNAAVLPGAGEAVIPGNNNAVAAAALLPDRELDEWLRCWLAKDAATGPIGWMHGDFFWRNVLCRQGKSSP